MNFKDDIFSKTHLSSIQNQDIIGIISDDKADIEKPKQFFAFRLFDVLTNQSLKNDK